MTVPSSTMSFNTFEEALDDLIDDWLEDEDPEDIVAALLAKVDAMQVVPEIATSEERIDVQEEKD
jgi:hypothetical protein